MTAGDAKPSVSEKPIATEQPAARVLNWLTPTIAGVGLTSLFSDWSHELATSLMPALLASLGAPPLALGLIEGLSDAASTAFKLAGGLRADRIANRKPLLIAGYAATVVKALFAVVTAWWQVLVLRMIAWAGRGLRNPVRDSLLADATPPAAYGRAFGFHRGMDTLGAILGPLTASVLLPVLGMRHIFLVSLLPGMLSVLAVAILVREVPKVATPDRPFHASLRRLPGRFRWLVGSAGVFGLGNYAHTFLILYAVTVLAPSVGRIRASALAIALYTMHNAVYAAGSFLIGVVADRVGKRGLLVAGYGLFAAMNALLIMVHPSLAVLGGAFLLAGLYIALVDAMEGALAADLLPADMRGTGYGVLAAVNGIGDLISGIAVGALWTLVGPEAGFAYAGALTLAGAALLWRIQGR